MYQPFGSRSAARFAFLCLATAFPLYAGSTQAAGAAQAPGATLPAAGTTQATGTASPAGAAPAAEASPGGKPAVEAVSANAPEPSGPVASAPVSAHPGPTAAQRLLIPPRAYRLKGAHPPAPLKRLTYSAREGFALRMVSNQDVTAEIRNGAGRTLAYTARTLEAGDWTLRPRNLAPGLYTVLLRTGPNLRVLRLEIQDAERGQGGPEWQLEKAADSTLTPGVLPRGARMPPADGAADAHEDAHAHGGASFRFRPA